MLFAVMFAVGALDHLAGNRFGLGRKFLEGLETFTPLFLTMTGFLVLTPLLTRLLTPVVTPLLTAVGADPGLVPGIILANDNGGYALAKEIAVRPEAAGERDAQAAPRLARRHDDEKMVERGHARGRVPLALLEPGGDGVDERRLRIEEGLVHGRNRTEGRGGVAGPGQTTAPRSRRTVWFAPSAA